MPYRGNLFAALCIAIVSSLTSVAATEDPPNGGGGGDDSLTASVKDVSPEELQEETRIVQSRLLSSTAHSWV